MCTTSSQSPSHCHYFNWIAQGCSGAMCFCIHCIRGAHAWKPGGNLHSQCQACQNMTQLNLQRLFLYKVLGKHCPDLYIVPDINWSLAHDVQRVNHLRSMWKCAVHVCACHLQYQYVLVGAIHTVANDTHSLPARLFFCLEARCKRFQMKHVTVPCFQI